MAKCTLVTVGGAAAEAAATTEQPSLVLLYGWEIPAILAALPASEDGAPSELLRGVRPVILCERVPRVHGFGSRLEGKAMLGPFSRVSKPAFFEIGCSSCSWDIFCPLPAVCLCFGPTKPGDSCFCFNHFFCVPWISAF